jgi:hypothetical protein
MLAGPAGGVGNAEIIELEGADVRTHFTAALSSIEATLDLLAVAASVIPESLPSETGVLPIAYVIARKPDVLKSAATKAQLLRWFWASTLTQRYGRGGTNTIVGPDGIALYNWTVGAEKEPVWITDFWSSFTATSLLEPQATNEVLMRGLYCVQNQVPARDWKTGAEIRTLGKAPAPGGTKPVSRLHGHHVFPTENPLPDSGGNLDTGELIPADGELVLNRVLILDTTNQSLHASPPSSLAEKGIDLALVESHLITPETLSSWDGFVRDRVRKLLDAIEVVLPRA